MTSFLIVIWCSDPLVADPDRGHTFALSPLPSREACLLHRGLHWQGWDRTRHPRSIQRPRGGECWQWFFLDAGINFWFECEAKAVEDALAEDVCVDFGQRYGLVGSRIGSVRGEPAPRIRVEFSVGELVVETTNPSVLDAPMRLRFRSIQS